MFKRETGAVVSVYGDILKIVEGDVGLVHLPSQYIWDIHKKSSGYVWGFIHTHPPGITEMSSTDKSTLEAWAMAFYPFPFNFVVATLNGISDRYYFSIKTYKGYLQSKDDLKPDQKERKVMIFSNMANPKAIREISKYLWGLSCK